MRAGKRHGAAAEGFGVLESLEKFWDVLRAGKRHGAAAEVLEFWEVWASFGGFCGLANGRLERS